MTQTITPTELLSDLRAIIDERETISQRDSELSKRKAEIEAQLLQVHESTGLDKFSGANMTVTFDDAAMRTKYDPEKWAAIMRWAVDNGHDFIIQRRLTDARVVGLINDGVALPEGLSVEVFTKISTRRI